MSFTTDQSTIGTMHVPVQTSGSEMNAIEQVLFGSDKKAKEFYKTVANRLTNVNAWAAMAKLPMSTFKLFDYAGRAVERHGEVGDFIRIDIPGPGTRTGHGYDWVIILLEENHFKL